MTRPFFNPKAVQEVVSELGSVGVAGGLMGLIFGYRPWWIPAVALVAGIALVIVASIKRAETI